MSPHKTGIMPLLADFDTHGSLRSTFRRCAMGPELSDSNIRSTLDARTRYRVVKNPSTLKLVEFDFTTRVDRHQKIAWHRTPLLFATSFPVMK